MSITKRGLPLKVLFAKNDYLNQSIDCLREIELSISAHTYPSQIQVPETIKRN